MKSRPYEIYLITAPGYWYVGSTTRTAEYRFGRHARGWGSAKKLYAKMEELGAESFAVEVIETGEGDRFEAEKRAYDRLLESGLGETLNGGRPASFGPLTEEGRRKMSLTHKGKVVSEETRAKQSASHLGQTLSEATKAKLAAVNRGNTYTKGKRVHTVESRAKISAALSARPYSAVSAAKISEARRSERARCGECPMVTHRGPMARHQTASGHVGTVALV